MALNLTRREGESIILQTSDGEIIVRVKEINGGQVKLSTEAPHNVEIDREEIYWKKKLTPQ